jgi:hypothetical protein
MYGQIFNDFESPSHIGIDLVAPHSLSPWDINDEELNARAAAYENDQRPTQDFAMEEDEMMES